MLTLKDRVGRGVSALGPLLECAGRGQVIRDGDREFLQGAGAGAVDSLAEKQRDLQ